MSTEVKKYPGEVGKAFPDVFSLKAMPPQPKEKKPGQLPEEQIRQFFEEVTYPQGIQWPALCS
jgi:hypothetical protein